MKTRRAALKSIMAGAVGITMSGRSYAQTTQLSVPGGAGRLNILRHVADGPPVLLVHPYSPGTAAAFDIPGLSWMRHLAARGRDAWAFDLMGFGASTRPAAMEGPPSAAPPVARASEGLKDLDSVASHILAVRGAASLDLIGWSFGSVLAAMYAIEKPERIRHLVLLGSMHGFDLPFMAEMFEEAPGVLKHDLPAYRSVTPAVALAHWELMRRSLPADIVSRGIVAAVQEALQASDPSRAPNVRQPMGPLVDLHAIWRGHPIYDAAAVTTATLVVRGDHDLFADKRLAAKLTNARRCDEIVIPESTHWVLFERQRPKLIAAVDEFLAASA